MKILQVFAPKPFRLRQITTFSLKLLSAHSSGTNVKCFSHKDWRVFGKGKTELKCRVSRHLFVCANCRAMLMHLFAHRCWFHSFLVPFGDLLHTQQCLVPGRHRKLKMQWPNKCHPADSRSVQFCLGVFLFDFFNPQHSPLARNPLTVHPCHYQKQQIINNRPLNLFCSKQYLIEVWTGCDGHKSMVWFLTFPQPNTSCHISTFLI